MTEHTEKYFICNSCGADSRTLRDHINKSPGNAFVLLRGQNTVTEASVLEFNYHVCSTCWCRVQNTLEGENPVPPLPVTCRGGPWVDTWTEERADGRGTRPDTVGQVPAWRDPTIYDVQ